MAERDYGIIPETYMDKADLIEEILLVEKQLNS